MNRSRHFLPSNLIVLHLRKALDWVKPPTVVHSVVVWRLVSELLKPSDWLTNFTGRKKVENKKQVLEQMYNCRGQCLIDITFGWFTVLRGTIYHWRSCFYHLSRLFRILFFFTYTQYRSVDIQSTFLRVAVLFLLKFHHVVDLEYKKYGLMLNCLTILSQFDVPRIQKKLWEQVKSSNQHVFFNFRWFMFIINMSGLDWQNLYPLTALTGKSRSFFNF